jgi:TolA-binding protein
MWFRAALVLGIIAALSVASALTVRQVNAHLKEYEDRGTRIVKLEEQLRQSRSDLKALQEAEKLDAQEALESFEKADWACVNTIKRVSAGLKVPPVEKERFIHVEVPGQCPIVELPPLFRLRELQEAGADPAPPN